MKTVMRSTLLAVTMLWGTYGATALAQPVAQAQAVNPMPAGGAAPRFRYPEADVAPSSTLRMREIPQTGTWGQQTPRPVTDTPESIELYRLCQQNADRAATDIADMRGRIAGCLSDLNQRREQGY